MFITLSYTTHTIISISLHVLGIVVGLFVWYLFPKHPTRSIIQLPSERVAVSIDSLITTKCELLHSSKEFFTSSEDKVDKLINFDDPHSTHISTTRHFG